MDSQTKNNPEMAIQREFIKWIRIEYPLLEVIWRKNEGKKSKLTATLDKKSGLRAGIPDLEIITESCGWSYYLELELKTLQGVLNPAQKEWHNNFAPTYNRSADVAYGFIDAKQKFINWHKKVKNNC